MEKTAEIHTIHAELLTELRNFLGPRVTTYYF